jgi:hypothetical protein
MNQEESNKLLNPINRVGISMNRSRKTQRTQFVNRSGEHQ